MTDFRKKFALTAFAAASMTGACVYTYAGEAKEDYLKPSVLNMFLASMQILTLLGAGYMFRKLIKEDMANNVPMPQSAVDRIIAERAANRGLGIV